MLVAPPIEFLHPQGLPPQHLLVPVRNHHPPEWVRPTGKSPPPSLEATSACSGHPVRVWRSQATECVDTAVQGEAGTKCPAGTAITAATRSALQSLLSESRPLTAAPHLAAAVLERLYREAAP